MPVVGDLRVLLRLTNFRRLLTVRLLSQTADGVYQVALATYVVFSPEKQTSPAAIASAMAVLLLPYSLIGPFAGVLLDRWRRRQVLLYGNLLRALLACGTALLILASVPDWLFYVSALSVTAINRFVLAGLSAALPRVVDEERLVIANALSPTAGTLAATAGGGLAFVVRLVVADSDAAVVLLGAALYLCAGLASLRMGRDLLGPDPERVQPRLGAALVSTARGLTDGLRHLARRPAAARVLTAVTLMRFCYGALLVTVLMLCRYAWYADERDGLALLGVAVAVSGAGFFVAAVITPWTIGRFGPYRWMIFCAATAAVLVPALGLPFAKAPILVAAFVLGLVTQGVKITTDTVVQISVDDAYRGRIFSLYDVLFNVSFVAAAAVAALILPPDGRSALLVVLIGAIYAGIALMLLRWSRTTPALPRSTGRNGRTD
ncbi:MULTISPECIES: MFS transporter [Streptomyces]|uniref:MFS transporter n=1 Tax=Streptomyces tsukubensis (strain DSM 42081 / NBRC 108919 / NRRL 18488 / 9993) TaxID=1114943 RepID=I2N211_STRT9|nr:MULTISPECIES: MFS transporter [Streptomyces]AZK95188.1 MFS transporter [Streptomyces tsukubensis]EIF91058.1 major facilitator transporter [Streptomyces tsukubensis NRRL18488]MYS64541.1 MFS transporter [Streptomyces sp. SID5473]QKM68751.1 MFS transporter [Streptomyces tsukubensis NRRL18488]TAI43556.1 MFS transporter [Streptomyces tsukubensis]